MANFEMGDEELSNHCGDYQPPSPPRLLTLPQAAPFKQPSFVPSSFVQNPSTPNSYFPNAQNPSMHTSFVPNAIGQLLHPMPLHLRVKQIHLSGL